MKPIDIFDAMDVISEKYIDEAEQTVKERSESRKGRHQGTCTIKANGNSSETISAQFREPVEQKHSGGNERISQNSRLPVWQRVMTGMAAAAACAVFIGGGWFIARQAKQMQPDTGSSTLEAEKRNILGGTGALHAAGSAELVYDDTRFYFDYVTGCGSRTPETLISAVSPYCQQTTELIYDNKYLYVADGFSLYRLGEDGNPESKPFFTVSEKTIAKAQNEFKATNPDVDDIFPEAFQIQMLTEDYYFVYVTISNSKVDQGLCGAAFFAFCYNAATGESSDILDYGTQTQPALVSTDGTAFYYKPYGFDGFCRITLDPYNAELFSVPEDMYISSGCGYDGWIVKDHTAYYITPGEEHDFSNVKYCKYDMNTKNCSVYEEAPDFSSFLVYDGMLYACNKAGTQICCTDPELQSKTVLFDFEKDVPEKLKASVSAAQDKDAMLRPITWIGAVDGNYLFAHLADCTYVLLDRQSGAVRFYQYPTDDDPAQNTDTDDQTDAVNALGGSGILHPVGWTNHGEASLLRDDNNYYYFDTCCWFACPLAGGQFTQISYPDNTESPYEGSFSGQYAFPYDGFISDGTRIYTYDLDIVSDGSADDQFDPADVQEYLHKINADAEKAGYHYSVRNIWHIRDNYFMVLGAIQTTDHGATEPGEIWPSDYEIWTDRSGKIMSAETVTEKPSSYHCSDDQHEMYAVIDQKLFTKDCPGEEIDCKPDPTAYGAIMDAYCEGGAEYYISADDWYLYTRENGQTVCILDREVPWVCNRLDLAPDQRFFYFQSENRKDNNDEMHFDMLYEWKGGGNKELIYAPENGGFLYRCGFETNGTGGYNIILFQSDITYKNKCYLFIDPDTHKIVKKLTA